MARTRRKTAPFIPPPRAARQIELAGAPPRLKVHFYTSPDHHGDHAPLVEAQQRVESALRALIAHPTIHRRKQRRDPAVARALLDAHGAAAFTDLDEAPGPLMTWAVRLYYRSEGDETLAAEFGGLSDARAEALAAEHGGECWNASPRLTEDGIWELPPPVKLGARVVIWPSEQDRRVREAVTQSMQMSLEDAAEGTAERAA